MIGYLFQGAQTNSTFAGGVGALQHASDGGGTHIAFGGRIGYRYLLPGTSLAVRFDAGYRSWLRYGGGNEFDIGLGLGGVVHSTK
jgi:hypothetical protein